MGVRIALLCVAVWMLAALPALGQGAARVTTEVIEYGGWKRNLRIRNGTAELVVTLDVGPRILSYRLAGGKNVFKEYEDQLGKSGEPDWQIRGGHRLWTAPEDLTRTYAPDNEPVVQTTRDDGTPVFTRRDPAYGIERSFAVRLESAGSRVTVTHRIQNTGSAPTELSAWALSVMAPGGIEIIPLPPGRPHPGSPTNARSPEEFAPDRHLVLWPFFDFTDPRWTFGSKFLLLRQAPDRGPTKLGLSLRTGWAGYLNGGTLFVKHVPFVPGATYPDRGSNYETFTNQDMLELETLSPLVRLEPGAAVEHVERWELIPNLGVLDTEGLIEREIVPRVGSW